MNCWKVYFLDDRLRIGTFIRFRGTRKINGIKVLGYKWFLKLRRNLYSEDHYKVFDNVKSIYAPDGEELSDYVFLVFARKSKWALERLRENFSVSEDIVSKIVKFGFIIGLSTANEVGNFGIWPLSFFKTCATRPDILLIAQILISDAPEFWDNVIVCAKSELIHNLKLSGGELP
jgi:hypothetical protein